jgi:hypothetical protein
LEAHFFYGEVAEVVTTAQMERMADFESDAAEIPVKKFAGGYSADNRADTERTRGR